MVDSSLTSTSSTFPNCTRDPESLFVNLDPVFMTYYFGVFAVMAVVNLGGNGLVLRTFYLHPSLRSPSNVFVCSLAMSDLLFGVLFPIYNVAGINRPGVNQLLGNWTICSILLIEVIALEMCSAYSLVAITVCRYIITSYPLRHQLIVTTRRCVTAVVILWMTSHATCIGLYGVRVPLSVTSGDYCRVCHFENLFTDLELSMMTAVQFLVPFTLMIAIYLRMACIARRLNNRIASGSFCSNDLTNDTSGMSRQHRRHKSFAIITLLIGCFVASYVPMLTYFFLIIVHRQSRVKYEYLSATSRIFLFLNTAVNIFIYAGRMADFRECLRRDRPSCTPFYANDVACCVKRAPIRPRTSPAGKSDGVIVRVLEPSAEEGSSGVELETRHV